MAEVGRLQNHVEQSKEHIASLHESLKKVALLTSTLFNDKMIA